MFSTPARIAIVPPTIAPVPSFHAVAFSLLKSANFLTTGLVLPIEVTVMVDMDENKRNRRDKGNEFALAYTADLQYGK